MAEAINHGNKIAFDEAAGYRQKVIDDKKAEVLPMTRAELNQWRKAMAPVWRQFEPEIGRDVINAALKANNRTAMKAASNTK
jgi:C4-dicarboxylate-binding protein DctP